MCHCSPAMSVTLRSLYTVHSWLSTVHSQQQECTPDSQECTVDREASEAWQTIPVNNVSQFRLSLERIVDYCNLDNWAQSDCGYAPDHRVQSQSAAVWRQLNLTLSGLLYLYIYSTGGYCLHGVMLHAVGVRPGCSLQRQRGLRLISVLPQHLALV